MADNRMCNQFKEAVCIDTSRIYDSCCDRDCLSDLRVHFTDRAQNIIDCAKSVRTKKAEIINTCIDVEEVPFNKGCFSVDITFFFKIYLDVFTTPGCDTQRVCGLATFSKKCVLFGGEGSVKTFSSEYRSDDNDKQLPCVKTAPRAKVQTVDPIVLDTALCKPDECCDDCQCKIPYCVANCFDGDFGNSRDVTAVKVTLGLFTIVQLERDVQMLIPAYDFCIPKKECCFNTEDPCDSFRRIKFPTKEFFPPSKNC